jgi:hypothetical protein
LLEENPGAVQVELSVHELKEIDGAVAATDVQGESYPEHLEQLVGR